MIYELFTEFCGVPSEMLANSPAMQKAFACASLALAVLGLYLIVYMFIVIFRGWK